MTTFISLLRGINIGKKQMRMEELRGVYASLGFADVRSYVQSGNVLFTSEEADPAKLANQIEAQIERAFGFATVVIIRTAPELAKVLAQNPFLNERQMDPDKLYVTFLASAPPERGSATIKNPSASDEFILAGSEIFVYCPDGYGRTKLNNTFFEKKFGVPATTRNWKTVNALYQMASKSE